MLTHPDAPLGATAHREALSRLELYIAERLEQFEDLTLAIEPGSATLMPLGDGFRVRYRYWGSIILDQADMLRILNL